MRSPFHNEPGSERHDYRSIPNPDAGDEEGWGSDDSDELTIVVQASEDFSRRGWREPPIRIKLAR